jgi:hypothetical protein
MDTIATALSTSWLDAVRRAQSVMHRNLAEQLPQTRASYPERKLTDVIERALIHGGLEPDKRADPTPSGHLVDRLA